MLVIIWLKTKNAATNANCIIDYLLFLKFHYDVFYRYESSGYDDTSFRKYSSSPYRPTLYSSQSPNMSGQESETTTQHHSQQQQHEIVCGPSFNESLERFRSATGSGTESDGGGPGGNYKQSTFKQQKYSSSSTSGGGINRSIQRTAVTKQVEEQRTMISRTSQKFISHWF